jgi:hypothetical protein
MELWVRRLAEVPQVDYESGSGLDRSLLPGHNDTPEIHYHDYEGNRDVSLLWPMGQGSTSASPAMSWEPTQRQGETTVEFKLRRWRELGPPTKGFLSKRDKKLLKSKNPQGEADDAGDRQYCR